MLLDRHLLHPRIGVRALSWAPRVFEIPGVLSDVECEELIHRAEGRLKPIGTFQSAAKVHVSPSASLMTDPS